MKKRLLTISVGLMLVFLFAVTAFAADEAKPESISFYYPYRTGYVGYSVGFSQHMTVDFYPDGTEESYTVTSSDESIVSMEKTGTGGYLANCLKEGTVTLTATSESGLTAQCTVNVKEPQYISLGDTKTITVQPGDVVTYIFEYEEYGDYVFYDVENDTTLLNSETKEGDLSIGYNWGRRYFTISEYSYFCRLNIWNDETTEQTYTVRLMEAVPVEKLTINIPSYYEEHYETQMNNAFPGDSVYINYVERLPENAKWERITWSSSDESVATMESGTVKFVGVGKATITATSESGATVSVDIMVKSPEIIQIGDEKRFEYSADQYAAFSFTPTESADYVFCFKNLEGSGVTRRYFRLADGSNVEDEQYYNKEEYFVQHAYLEEGKEYIMSVCGIRLIDPDGQIIDQGTGIAELQVEKAVAFDEEISLISEADPGFWELNGDAATARVSRFSAVVKIDFPLLAKPETYRWTSSDESIVSVLECPFDISVYSTHNASWQASLYFVNPGTATITVTSDSGKTASFTVTVYEYEYYESVLGEHKNGTDEQFEICVPSSEFVKLVQFNGLGETVVPEDAYTIVEGSSPDIKNVTLKASYLDTLDSGWTGFGFYFLNGNIYQVHYILVHIENEDIVAFTDVPDGAWFADQVEWAVASGITNGMTANTFAPDNTCTRNQVVTFLWRAEGSPEPTSTENPFVDVKETDYFYKAVLWAVENGVTTGMDKTHFNPNGECTRAQVVTFLHRAAQKPAPASTKNPFSDVKQGYYTDAVLWAVGEEITTGITATTFAPENTCTRAQIVTFLYRYKN